MGIQIYHNKENKIAFGRPKEQNPESRDLLFKRPYVSNLDFRSSKSGRIKEKILHYAGLRLKKAVTYRTTFIQDEILQSATQDRNSASGKTVRRAYLPVEREGNTIGIKLKLFLKDLP